MFMSLDKCRILAPDLDRLVERIVFICPSYSRGESIAMVRFKEAEERLLNKKICMKCNARNAPKATRCRKCGYTHLRPKAKESRKS